MERKIHAELLEWKDDPDRKPMILLGCRQVGKTFIVMEFGDREYENIAYLNFADNPDDRLLFQGFGCRQDNSLQESSCGWQDIADIG